MLTQRALSPDTGRGKDANPTTLLTRFAEELRRAPAAGGGGISKFGKRKAESGIRKKERGRALPCGVALLELFDGE